MAIVQLVMTTLLLIMGEVPAQHHNSISNKTVFTMLPAGQQGQSVTGVMDTDSS